MSAMMAAIKKKKLAGIGGDHAGMMHGAQHADDPKDAGGESKDLHGLVASLSHSEKQNLKTLLDADTKGAEGIAKGAPSSEEKGHIQEAMGKEDQTNQAIDHEDGLGEPDSDDLAMSMLDSRDKSMPTHKPKNLGERMRMNLASKLKGKGKI